MEPFAEFIRSCAQISGQGEVEHKVGSHADDVLLIMTNPIQSLPEVNRVIAEFGSISFYKVNTAKLQMLGVHSPQEFQKLISNHTNFTWATHTRLIFRGTIYIPHGLHN